MKTKKAMKKITHIVMAALVAMGMLGTSCNKAESPEIETPETQKENIVTLTTTVGFAADGTKALTSTGVKTFGAGDQMAVIYKNTSGGTVKAVGTLTSGAGTKSGTFTFTLTNPDKTQNVTYIYPAAMAGSTDVDYTKLNSQDGTLASLQTKYDLATNSGAWNAGALPSLTLNNQLAILAITLKNADGSTDITSSITGLTLSDGTNSYAVTRSAAAGPIYVAIQPTSSASIEVTATDGSTNYTKSLTGKTYAAGNGYSLSWRMTAASSVPAGAIDSKFTINADGDQVYFSQGNLQATYNGSSWTWAFAENQWDYYTTYSANSWDKFGWSTSTTTYGMNTSTSNSTYSGDFKDWGDAVGSGWRTLTSDEWTYVFNTRTTGGTVFGTAQARYAHATINTDGTSVNGMILFPDGVDIAATEVTTAGTVNNTSAYATKCTTAQWSALAAKGCVFLPAAGYRLGASVDYAGSYGIYWSSSPNGTYRAYSVFFYSGYLSPALDSSRLSGFSVRLVREVE